MSYEPCAKQADLPDLSYIEDFWYASIPPCPLLCIESCLVRYESYLSHSDPVVLTLNPFFVLE